MTSISFYPFSIQHHKSSAYDEVSINTCIYQILEPVCDLMTIILL